MSDHANAGGGKKSSLPLQLATAALALGVVVVAYFVVTSASTSAPVSSGSGPLDPAIAGGTASATAQSTPIETINAATAAADDYMRQGQYVNAGVILDRAAAKFPDDPTIRQMYAAALLGQKRFPAALEQMEAALQHGPQSARTLFDTGVVASQAQNPTRAAELFTLASMKDPAEAQYPLYLGMTQVRLNQSPAAAASLAKALKIKPDLAEAWGTLAEMSFNDNALDLALDQVQRARTLQPDALRWRIVNAKILKRQSKPQESVDLLQNVQPIDLVKFGGLSTLTESLGLLNKPLAAAVVATNAAIEQNDNAELFYNAAEWWQRGGDNRNEMANLEKAADLGSTKAKERLAGLSKGKQ